MEVKKQSLFTTIFGMMINPAGTLKGALRSTKWYISLIVSTLAFSLFFMQTGLDLYKTGQKPFTYVILSAVLGGGYGLFIIPALGILIWIILKVMKSKETMTNTIASFCLSYSGALIYGILGLIFSLVLGWKTAIAFGVTGVLWAVGPMIVAIRELTGGKNKMSIPIATIISALILLSWAYLGNL